jgi:hypothetical protein
MAALDLRPLSLGEILDRTFSLYRQNFPLFMGITAIPQLLVLALGLAQVAMTGTSRRGGALANIGSWGVGGVIVGALLGVIVYMVSYLYAHGAAVFAVSDIYLGRTATVGGSFRKMRGRAAMLFGVLFLQGLAVVAGFIFLIFPGFYVACRLSTTVPAALLEDLGPGEALNRSFTLTQENAGRAFGIFVLYFALFYAMSMLLSWPFLFLIVYSTAQKNLALLGMWTALNQVGNFIAVTLVTPILTIATTVFYYDLRVRKEAFDLQMMMTPGENPGAAPAAPGLPSMFS